ncbi:MAG TPA: zf-HC2 domain-containing protein [Candidatus Polarisedimenticolia bacterium]|nr:zf-HC2 domain-containing protein [Candidatus Polarisedimenticolia bacterium]
MRTCEDIVVLLSGYIDGDLDGVIRRQLDEHMRDCGACLEFLDSLRSTRDAVRTLGCDDIPADVQRALRAFLDRATRRDPS